MNEKYMRLLDNLTRAFDEHEAAKAAVQNEMDQATKEMRLAFNNQMPSWLRYSNALTMLRAESHSMCEFLRDHPHVLVSVLPKELPQKESVS